MSEVNITKEIYFERQLVALGKVSLNKIHNQKILLINLKAVGCEVAKNLALASPTLLTLIDDSTISEEDLCFNFFATRSDFGKKKTSVMKER